MNKIVFEFDDYRTYLKHYMTQLPKRGYGFKSRLAEVLDCNTSYISQLLKGTADLSLEQAANLNPFLKHNEIESEFFLALVGLARAGNENLRIRYRHQITQLRDQQNNLKLRFKEKAPLTESDLTELFSLWYRNAIQICLTIPHLRSVSSIQKALGLEENLVRETLLFLQSKGLVEEKSGHYFPTESRIFIGKDSAVLKVHHSNWRNRAIFSLDQPLKEDLHYTSLFTLSKKEAAIIRESMIHEIEKIRNIVKASPEEEIHACLIDYFRVDKI